MIKIGVLISGGGTNLQALIDSTKDNAIDGEVALIISNRRDVYGLKRGEKAGIKSIFLDPKDFSTSEDYNKALIKELKKEDVDLIVLAGFLRVLSKDFIQEFENRIINIHPSLIPSFCGKGYYGEYVHQCVLDRGVKFTGATVHFVDEGTDTGPIILQKVVEVEEEETLDSLQKKVLEIEHEILVEAVSLFSKDKLIIKDHKVRIDRGQ